MKPVVIFLAAACLGVPAASTANAEAAQIVLAQADGENAQGVTLEGTEWRVLELNGKEAVEGVLSTLAFAENGAVSGSGGCNRFRGDVEIKGTTMKFGPIASTMMACEEDKSRQEGLFHAAMEQTASYSLEEEQLKLIDAAGTTVALLGKP